jgi:hypothetical protein
MTDLPRDLSPQLRALEEALHWMRAVTGWLAYVDFATGDLVATSPELCVRRNGVERRAFLAMRLEYFDAADLLQPKRLSRKRGAL